uniref:Uncharacterized protein n=1 Tax=Arundo donax TaxID=35708 RepID=A0A0A8Z8G8_ARUDO
MIDQNGEKGARLLLHISANSFFWSYTGFDTKRANIFTMKVERFTRVF